MEQFTDEYWKAGVLAQILSVSREYVYKHADEFGGIKLGKKTIRFSKKLFDKIMEVKSNGGLQTQGEMDVRLLEERYGDFYGCSNYPKCKHTEKQS